MEYYAILFSCDQERFPILRPSLGRSGSRVDCPSQTFCRGTGRDVDHRSGLRAEVIQGRMAYRVQKRTGQHCGIARFKKWRLPQRQRLRELLLTLFPSTEAFPLDHHRFPMVH
jgi:hypothetical protein